MQLTEEQIDFLQKNSKKYQDLNVLTQKCFENDDLDGRTKEGRSVRKFLIENDIKFNTQFKGKQEPIKFSKEQKEFIIQQAEEYDLHRQGFQVGNSMGKRYIPFHCDMWCELQTGYCTCIL